MAVETPKLLRDFWPRFHRQAIALVILPQVVIVGLFVTVMVLTNIMPLASMWLWMMSLGLFLVGSSASLIVLGFVSRPGKDLLAAVMNVSGERSNLTPPNPNDKRYEKSAFKQALQTIYELASRDRTPETAPVAQAASGLEAALNETTCGFVTMNHERKITFSNKATPTNQTTEGVLSLNLLFNGSDTLDAWLDECEKSAVHAEHVWTRIPDRLPEEEGRRLFDVMASYEKGNVNETVLTLVDRTASYEVGEEDLDFIAFAAHELRGPITVIRGYLEVLEGELGATLQPDQHELFRRLTVSANRLSGYINNILNTSRYDRRHLKAHLTEDTVADIYATIADDMQLRASAQNRLLSVSFPADLPTIAADRASLSEVMGNLIDNAIKYSNEGGAINVTAIPKGEFVEISVEDHGIGMPGNVVSNLFQKFYRSHRSRETVAGTGIGLYISKAIVESHGGTIGVRSVEGEGSTFIVDVPIYATVADKLKASDNSNETLMNRGTGWIKNHSMYRG
jgi:signal transduction histidine kinase